MVDRLQTKSIITPDLTDVLANFKRDIFATMNCIKIGWHEKDRSDPDSFQARASKR